MTDPFKIAGPALVSFSGGRTSGYMLRRILQAHGGTLPDDVKVTFANTGKEMPQTLDFVRDCGERWSVDVAWLQYRDAEETTGRWERVTYATAARAGEPFKALIARKQDRGRSRSPDKQTVWGSLSRRSPALCSHAEGRPRPARDGLRRRRRDQRLLLRRRNMTDPGAKTPAWIAEAMQWERFVSSVQNDMREDPAADLPASPATRQSGSAWLTAYKERRRHHPVGRIRGNPSGRR